MKAKQKRQGGSIDFLTYEGLQVKYEQYELIIIPKEITDSKVGDSGEDYIQAFWKLGRSIEEVPNYHVKWKRHSKYKEVVYTNENDKDEVPFNKTMNDFATKKGVEITTRASQPRASKGKSSRTAKNQSILNRLYMHFIYKERPPKM